MEAVVGVLGNLPEFGGEALAPVVAGGVVLADAPVEVADVEVGVAGERVLGPLGLLGRLDHGDEGILGAGVLAVGELVRADHVLGGGGDPGLLGVEVEELLVLLDGLVAVARALEGVGVHELDVGVDGVGVEVVVELELDAVLLPLGGGGAVEGELLVGEGLVAARGLLGADVGVAGAVDRRAVLEVELLVVLHRHSPGPAVRGGGRLGLENADER